MQSRAVVDTNILVSALLKPGSPPDAVIQAIRRDLLQPVVCSEIMSEYGDVLPRPRLGLLAADTTELLSLIAVQALWVHITPYSPPPELPDPADWPFIATALAAGCPVVTGNVKHFPAKVGVAVLTPAEWVESMGQQSG